MTHSILPFREKLLRRLEHSRSPLCVGLDSRFDRIPHLFGNSADVANAIERFNRGMIQATHSIAAAYKCNLAFYAAFGSPGLDGLRATTKYLKANHPDIPLLADCKRSEMGQSVQLVKQEVIDDLGFDCVMVTPWFGFDTVEGYLQYPEVGVAVYVHDSNPSAPEFQDLRVAPPKELRPPWLQSETLPLYEYVTWRVCHYWNSRGNIFLEAGLTYPETLRRVRDIAGPDMPMLVAGLGAQGGKAEDLTGLFGTNSNRLFVNVSRGIIFPEGAETSTSESSYCTHVEEAAKKFLRDISASREPT